MVIMYCNTLYFEKVEMLLTSKVFKNCMLMNVSKMMIVENHDDFGLLKICC